MAAGLNSTLTLAQMNQDYGSDVATIRNSFDRLQRRYNTHWVNTGPTDYIAAGGASGDRDTLGSAITEMINLNAVRLGTANVASNGTVTTGTTGHNFDTFPARVCGDNVQ